MSTTVTLHTLHQHMLRLEQQVRAMQETLLQEPELRSEFIVRMEAISQERSLSIPSFRAHYHLE